MTKIKIHVAAVVLIAAASLGFSAQAQSGWTYDAKAAAAAAAQRNTLQEEHNRALVLYFSEQVFNKHDLAVAEAMLAPEYRQHNPKVPDGRDAFIAYFKNMVFAGDPGVHSDVVRSATDGDLVYVHVRQYNGEGKPRDGDPQHLSGEGRQDHRALGPAAGDPRHCRQ